MSTNSGIKGCENENWVFQSKKYSLSSESVSNNFKTFSQDGTLCDVDLISGDKVVKAHRVVLAAACVYFETMFKSDFKERDMNSVSLPSISPEVLPLVVEFIYTGQTVICGSTVQHLVDAANMLQLGELSAGCAQYLKKHLRPDNVLEIIRLAETHNLMPLAEQALNYARDNWPAVAEEDEIVNLPLTLLTKLLSADSLMTDNEIQVLHVAVKWLNHDPASRRQHYKEVMQLVPLRKVSPQAFEKAVANVRDPALMEILDVFKVVLWAVNKEMRFENKSSLYVVGGCWFFAAFHSAWKFDRKTWTQMASMNELRQSHGVAAMGKFVYAVGGVNNHGTLTSAEVYDPRTDSWTTIASMKRPRYNFGLTAVNNKLFAFGGYQESSIEVYDPAADQWTLVGNMPEVREGMNAVTYGGAVYIVGGRTPTYPTNDVLRYVPQRAEWQRLRPLLPGDDAGYTFCAATAVHGSHLYVVGGFRMERKVGRYNLETEESYVAAEMSVRRLNCVVGVLNNVLVVAGGDVGITEMYDLTAGHWTTGPPLPEGRQCAGAAVL